MIFNNIKFKLDTIFAGIQKFSLIDYDGYSSIVLFTGGCDFRCKYCHNKELINCNDFIENREIINFLYKRKDQIDAVVISGGEPTIHSNLIEWIRFIKEMGYKIKLDTNGRNTNVIKKIIRYRLVDYIAIDYKGHTQNYKYISGVNIMAHTVRKNIKDIVDSGIKYQIRTTVHDKIINENDIYKLTKELEIIGVINYCLQNAQKNGSMLEDIGENNFSLSMVLKDDLGKIFKQIQFKNF